MKKIVRSFLMLFVLLSLFVVTGCKKDDSIDVTGSENASAEAKANANHRHEFDINPPSVPHVYFDSADNSGYYNDEYYEDDYDEYYDDEYYEDEYYDDYDEGGSSASYVMSGDVLERDYTSHLADPDGIYIYFEQYSDITARPVDYQSQNINELIKITPHVEGEWHWYGEFGLRFFPVDHWPAATEFKVSFDRSLFSSNYKLKRYDGKFTTEPFEAVISNLQLYQEPITDGGELSDPYVAATVSFNYPVDPASFEKNTTVRLDGKPVSFKATYDTVKRFAYIRTSGIPITNNAPILELKVPTTVTTSMGGARLREEQTHRINMPTMKDFFKLNNLSTTIVTTPEENRQQQMLMFDFSIPVAPKELASNVVVYKLPQNYQNSSAYNWLSIFDSTPAEDLAKFEKIKLEFVETGAPNMLGAKFFVHPNERVYIGVHVKKGMKSINGYALAEDAFTVFTIPRFSTELRITQDGTILTLSGDRTLTFLSRGLDKAKVSVHRIQDDRLNHLISQTSGDMKYAYFSSYSFNENDISEVFTEEITLNNSDPSTNNYFSLDLGKYLSDSNAAGVFIVNVYPWSQSSSGGYFSPSSIDRRMIQITDLGIIMKQPVTGPLNVFAVSMRSGQPIGGATVSLLARNGKLTGATTTNSSGMASLASYNPNASNENRQIAVVVQRGKDYSFIPIERNEVVYNRFEVGGEYSSSGRDNIMGLKSYLFTDRGLYRPGDTVNIGAIVKQDDWKSVAGVPMELTIINPRGQTVLTKRFTMDDAGFTEVNFPTNYSDPTGVYRMNLNVVRDSSSSVRWEYRQVGSTSFSLEEFKPDTMKINAVIAGKAAKGWLLTDGVRVDVTLNNLFGRPAQNRRIEWRYYMSPASFYFSEFKDFTFADPYRDNISRGHSGFVTIPEARTDDNGFATAALDLSAYTAGMYSLNVYAEGFEDGSGDSVNTIVTKYVSPLKYLMGYKKKGDFNYAKKDGDLEIEFIAINPDLAKIDLSGLEYKIVEKRHVSLLVRQHDGTYAFQSVQKELDVSSGKLNISKDGTKFKLPTANPGSFYMQISDANTGLKMAKIDYFVAGSSNLTLSMDKNTELSLTLSKKEYNTGEDIELNIIAPYTGTGLITIERDRVYAYKWFTTTTTSSKQTIRVPDDLEGNGYVNVSFVRSPSSKEVFSMPHVYAVAPFNVNRAAHTINVEIDVPDEAKPGEPLEIGYMTSRAGRIVVYAVDEGILQVANYSVPRPLDSFMSKRALQVRTFQILNQLLTDYSVMRQVSGIGGDNMMEMRAMQAMAEELNPFKRKVDEPVVFWSGILDVNALERGTATFDVPPHFNGTLRVMAVAVNQTAVGVNNKTMLVRAPIIVQPNMPLVLAPGDKAGMSVTISNNIAGSGDNVEIIVEAKGDKYISLEGETKQTIKLNEGYEGRVDFNIIANDLLGGGEVVISAYALQHPDTRINITSTASVRPPVIYDTVVTVGASNKKTVTLADFSRDMYVELAKRNATASHSPLLVARGLSAYLKAFPHGCTEQVVSQAFPALKIRGTFWTEQEAQDAFRHTVDVLRSRQMSNGGFTLWSGGWATTHEFATVYAMHYLTEAKLAGFSVPSDLFSAGQKWLSGFINNKAADLFDARLKVYAAYVLTRGGVVTSAFLANMEEYLNKEFPKTWKSDVISSFMAAIYKMHKMDERAAELIKGYIPEVKERFIFYSDFDSSSLRNTQYLYILAAHFSEEINKIDIKIVLNLLDSIADQHYSSLLSSFSILALYSFAEASAGYDEGMQIRITAGNDKDMPLDVEHNPYPTAYFTSKIDKLVAESNNESKFGLFLVATEQGYDLNPPKKSSKGIEVTRTYFDTDGKVKKTFKQGDDVVVQITVKTSGNMSYIENGIITDLLPGAFEVQMDSINQLRRGTFAGSYGIRAFDYVDVREDRLVFYAPIRKDGSTFTYTARVVSRGEFTVPPVYASSMYDPVYRANSDADKLVSTED